MVYSSLSTVNHLLLTLLCLSGKIRLISMAETNPAVVPVVHQGNAIQFEGLFQISEFQTNEIQSLGLVENLIGHDILTIKDSQGNEHEATRFTFMFDVPSIHVGQTQKKECAVLVNGNQEKWANDPVIEVLKVQMGPMETLIALVRPSKTARAELSHPIFAGAIFIAPPKEQQS